MMDPTASASSPESRGRKHRGLLRRRTGIVGSDKGDKTIVVVCDYLTRHPKYGKALRRRMKLHAHDEKNEARVGDRVEVAACRRVSKSKSWRLVRVLERA